MTPTKDKEYNWERKWLFLEFISSKEVEAKVVSSTVKVFSSHSSATNKTSQWKLNNRNSHFYHFHSLLTIWLYSSNRFQYFAINDHENYWLVELSQWNHILMLLAVSYHSIETILLTFVLSSIIFTKCKTTNIEWSNLWVCLGFVVP